MNKRIRMLSLLLCLSLIASLLTVAVQAESGGFYRTSGRQILDGDGDPVILKGISFGNTNYGNLSTIDGGAENDHDAASYFELARMGLDHVRFEFNYGLFEDDDNPYVYKESGFQWFDQNIAWAKAAGIKLILQMKSAQGGYQSATSRFDENDVVNSGGKFLWVGNKAEENQDRLVALWQAIAKRYKDEPTIIGYGLLNEPAVPEQATAAETTAVWQNLAQRIADAIREVDQNHMLFVECVCSWFNADDYNKTNWNLLTTADKQFLINDNNTVYEFHFYDPLEYTHQGASWTPQYQNTVLNYPTVTYNKHDWNAYDFTSSSATSTTEDGWVYYETEPLSIKNNNNVIQMQFSAGNLPAGASVWFDDVAITRYDTQGASETLYSNDFSGDMTWEVKVWSNSKLVTGHYDTSVGHRANGSLCLTNNDTSPSGPYDNGQSYDPVIMEPGYTYKVSGWVKNNTGVDQHPTAAHMRWPVSYELNKNYLETMLQAYLTFSTKNNVPLHVGEWGFHYNCYDRGAARYTADLTALFEKNNLSSNYHSYHDSTFGLYLKEEYEPREERNETLYKLLMTNYGSAPVGDHLYGAVVEDGSLTAHLQTTQEAQIVAVCYDARGQMLSMASCPAAAGSETAQLTLPELASAAKIRLFLLDKQTGTPLCIPWESK